ncbi:MAG: 16S rRNA (uracil(1498)-N(3))-methyltransferase [Epsilonproteobacteria bacterium]|nr:16S rRNA (uracil(1498)-N(3))-methyltransferase [Campylobacterota bacterium]
MQYLYRGDGGALNLKLEGDDFRYIVKARRHRVEESIAIRNLEDDNIYFYKIENITKRAVTLQLIEQRELIVESKGVLNIGWCIIEPKVIEKTLPSINEMGVNSITFIYCKRSQKNFKLDLNRLKKILINSSQQCGRSSLMELNIIDNLEQFLKIYPDAKMLNFSKNIIKSDIKNIVVGCEGGFSSDEVSLFRDSDIVGFQTPLTLRSQSAVCGVVSRILL